MAVTRITKRRFLSPNEPGTYVITLHGPVVPPSPHPVPLCYGGNRSNLIASSHKRNVRAQPKNDGPDATKKRRSDPTTPQAADGSCPASCCPGCAPGERSSVLVWKRAGDHRVRYAGSFGDSDCRHGEAPDDRSRQETDASRRRHFRPARFRSRFRRSSDTNGPASAGC